MAYFVFGDCDVTNLEMEFALLLGDVVSTASVNFFDKYLLFLSWKDLEFMSTISFLFSLCFWNLSVDKGVCITDGGNEKFSSLCSCRLLFLSFIFRPSHFWWLNFSFFFFLDKALLILAFSHSFSSYSVDFVALFWWYFALFFLFSSSLLFRFCHHFFIFSADVVCFSNFCQPISGDWGKASSNWAKITKTSIKTDIFLPFLKQELSISIKELFSKWQKLYVLQYLRNQKNINTFDKV